MKEWEKMDENKSAIVLTLEEVEQVQEGNELQFKLWQWGRKRIKKPIKGEPIKKV
jgi:hypothetical protein